MTKNPSCALSDQFSIWNKTTIANYVSNMLKRLPAGITLQGMDEKIALWLLQRHPKSLDKIGAGVDHIEIALNPHWGGKNKYLEIVRVDGTRIDFSYRKALAGKEPDQIDLFRAACRSAIEKDIIEFKLQTLKNTPSCRYRNIELDKDNSHVDHVKPKTFNWLVDEFIKKYQIDINQTIIGGEKKRQFLDERLEKAFRTFHKEIAHLELVSAAANQSECK